MAINEQEAQELFGSVTYDSATGTTDRRIRK